MPERLPTLPGVKLPELIDVIAGAHAGLGVPPAVSAGLGRGIGLAPGRRPGTNVLRTLALAAALIFLHLPHLCPGEQRTFPFVVARLPRADSPQASIATRGDPVATLGKPHSLSKHHWSGRWLKAH